MKRKRIISILLLLIIVLGEIASFPKISSAEPVTIDGVTYYDYRDFVEERIREKHKMPYFKTPVPIFTIEADGKKVLVEPDEDMQPGVKNGRKPHGKLDEVPLLQYTDDEGNKKDFVIPVGTEIKLDASPSIGGRKSHKHPRGKIIRYDWQIGKGYNVKTKRWKHGFDTDKKRKERGEEKWTKKQTPSFKVTKPGDYFIFLNVMDDFNELGCKKEPFRNWSENGNWRDRKSVV